VKSGEGKQIRRVTWIGLGLNVLLCVLKFFAGIVGRSQTIVADAVHSLSDTVTDVAVLVGSHFWTQPADPDHPYGHRRIESLVTLFIGLALVGTAVGLGWRAVASIRREHPAPPGWIAFYAALISIVSKEWLYRWTVKEGRRLDSLSLQANAWHHRSDAFSSIPALIAVSGALLLPAWPFLDHAGALIVSAFIMHAAFKIMSPRVSEILESGAPSRVRQRIAEIAGAVEGVREVHRLRSRYVSSHLHVDLHVLVDPDMSVKAAHDIATEVSRRIVRDAPPVLDVVVHIEPIPRD